MLQTPSDHESVSFDASLESLIAFRRWHSVQCVSVLCSHLRTQCFIDLCLPSPTYFSYSHEILALSQGDLL